jgi:hypothetical protein
VRTGISSARTLAEFVRGFYALFACLGVAAAVFALPEPQLSADQWLGFGVVFMILVVIHAAGQWTGTQVPRTHGRGLAVASVSALVFLPLGFVGLASRPMEVGAVIVGVGAVGASFALWLAFLIRLGQSLGDSHLERWARAYTLWFGFGLVQSALLLGTAYLLALVGFAPGAWVCRALAGVIGYLMLHRYVVLLRAAVMAIDRRAPTAPGS